MVLGRGDCRAAGGHSRIFHIQRNEGKKCKEVLLMAKRLFLFVECSFIGPITCYYYYYYYTLSFLFFPSSYESSMNQQLYMYYIVNYDCPLDNG